MYCIKVVEFAYVCNCSSACCLNSHAPGITLWFATGFPARCILPFINKDEGWIPLKGKEEDN